MSLKAMQGGRAVAIPEAGDAQEDRARGTGSFLLALPFLPGVLLLLLAASYLLGEHYCEPIEALILGAAPSGLAGILLLTTVVAVRMRTRSGYLLGWFMVVVGSLAAAALLVLEAGYVQAGGMSAAFAGGFIIVAALALLMTLGFGFGLWLNRATFSTVWQPADVVAGGLVLAAIVVFVALRMFLSIPVDPTPEDCSSLTSALMARSA
jgi:hypothetical protein